MIQALNKMWLNYEGKKTGVYVKDLINRVMSNANTYQYEPEKILTIILKQDNVKTIIKYEENNLEQYMNESINIYKEIITRENYNISFDYNDKNYLIDTVIIRKDEEKITEEELEIERKISLEQVMEKNIKKENIDKIEDIMDEYIPPIFMWLIFTSPLWIILIVCIHSYRKKDKK